MSNREHKAREALLALTRAAEALLVWEDVMGGWEAPCWPQMRQAVQVARDCIDAEVTDDE